MPFPNRPAGVLLCLGLCLLSGCKLGLDYTGSEAGLRREQLAVEGHEGRTLSYLIDGDARDQRLIFIHGSPRASPPTTRIAWGG